MQITNLGQLVFIQSVTEPALYLVRSSSLTFP